MLHLQQDKIKNAVHRLSYEGDQSRCGTITWPVWHNITCPASWCWLSLVSPISEEAECRHHRLNPNPEPEQDRSLSPEAERPADTETETHKLICHRHCPHKCSVPSLIFILSGLRNMSSRCGLWFGGRWRATIVLVFDSWLQCCVWSVSMWISTLSPCTRTNYEYMPNVKIQKVINSPIKKRNCQKNRYDNYLDYCCCGVISGCSFSHCETISTLEDLWRWCKTRTNVIIYSWKTTLKLF